MLTEPELLALLRELDALEAAQAVIDARSDLTENFTWQSVAAAIRDRRRLLIARAETMLGAEADPQAPALTADLPPGRIH